MEPLKGNMVETSNSETVCTKQQRIATLAKQSPQMGFTSLAYHMDIGWLEAAFARTRKDAAVGVDEQTAQDYAVNLQENLQSLLDRAKSGTYYASAVRRAYIPKGEGKEKRPIGIPTLEDKVLQRAVAMLLEPIYEHDFHDGSYGSRPGRSAHQALQSLWEQAMDMGGCWLVEVDIRKFFDTMDRGHLREFLKRRVRDGVLRRLISKWLHAGVLEEGAIWYPTTGTPQGAVISPLLANIYLHYVLDEWFEQQVKPRLRGQAFLIRYADDFVMGFSCEEDARRVMEVLPKRMGKYGLTLHPEKTRLLDFRRPQSTRRGVTKSGTQPGTFDLLGFTHYWGRSRRGNWVVKRKTASSRFRRAVKKIALWCRWCRHTRLGEQHQILSRKLQGHYGYYGITGNIRMLQRFRRVVTRVWFKWLRRRGGRRRLNWDRFNRILKRLSLPPARVVHSVYRLAANP